MSDKYKKYEPIFGSWYLARFLGRGSFGEVYEIYREEYGTSYRSALKVISIPQDEDDIKTRMTEGTDLDTVSEYYEEVLKEIIKENEIMSKLKGNSNIVSYEDHQIVPHEDNIGYDILIRMELLTPLLDRMLQKKLEENEVAKLGVDICKALELCHERKIIHRDIKPQNIFISESGDYKLGDFGIARTIEKTIGGMSKKGTYKYMAPEVFKGEVCDSRVDIYSLGLVLYSLLNDNRGPFLPPAPEKLTPSIEENARNRRFNGELFAPPKGANPILARVILKACNPDPKERYRSASDMKADLEAYLANYNHHSPKASGDYLREETEVDPLYQNDHIPPVNQYVNVRDIDKASGKKPIWILAVVVALVAIAAITGVFLYLSGKDDERGIDAGKGSDETEAVQSDVAEEAPEEVTEGASEELSQEAPEEIDDSSQRILSGPENTEAYDAYSTSVLAPQGDNTYFPENVTDRNYNTAWVEGVKGTGAGESITVTFNNKYPIEAVFIANGYQKSEKVYYTNHRVKDVELEFDDGSIERCTLKDYKDGAQLIMLSQAHKSNTVTLRIISAYAGDDEEKDTCLTEISLADPNRLDEYTEPIVYAEAL